MWKNYHKMLAEVCILYHYFLFLTSSVIPRWAASAKREHLTMIGAFMEWLFGVIFLGENIFVI